MNLKCRYFLRAACFIVIGILLFMAIQSVFMPKRVSYTKAYDAGKLEGFYEEESNSIDVLICSTSHSGKAILPMEMYEKYGITSYNLSTSTQPIEATYYMLSEALQTQSPKVFIFDVSNLYFSSVEAKFWWFVLDEMHFGKNKTELLQEYKRSANGSSESKGELLFPLVRYHTRWKELRKDDFSAVLRDKHDYSKGGQINSSVSEADISVKQMNQAADALLQNVEKLEYVYDDGDAKEILEEQILYDVDIPEKNLEWLRKIKDLCDENGIQLLAVKVPTICMPQLYRSAWVEEKYHKMQSLCNEYGIAYYDLLYDTDVGIDWDKDTSDEGQHLNLYGAQKVSADLGEYLKTHYGLFAAYNEQWDKDLLSYQKIRKTAQLELEGDLPVYLEMLANEYRDNTIFISMAYNGETKLNEEDIRALKTLGLQSDFSDVSENSYIAVIEAGRVRYEALSNRQLNYGGVCDQSGAEYNVYSSGWWTGADTSIKLNGTEYVTNHKGLCIVVYDAKRDLVIDSVCFDTCAEEYTAARSNTRTNGFEEAFEKYIIEEEH